MLNMTSSEKDGDMNTSEKCEYYKKFILNLNDVDDEFYEKILDFLIKKFALFFQKLM